MENNGAEFMLRQLTKGDMPFVFNSFLKSFRDAPSMIGIPNGHYYAGQHTLIERLVLRPNAVALVACAKDSATQIYGYVIGEQGPHVGAVLHWVYVKHPFRGFGIGKTLELAVTQASPDVFFTHRVRPVERLLRNRAGYTYNPFLLMEPAK